MKKGEKRGLDIIRLRKRSIAKDIRKRNNKISRRTNRVRKRSIQ